MDTSVGDMVTSDSWLEPYERYARLQNMNDVSGLALTWVTWHQSLDDEGKNDWPILRDRFLQCFWELQQALWQQERDLYQR